MNDAFAQQKISEWLEELLHQPEFDHVFPVDVVVKGNRKVEVYIDADDAVDFALCRTISRQLEERLDDGELLGERYTLEVSSPGTARPLTLPRQFKKHLGRTLEVTIDDETKVKGDLTEVSETGLLLKEEVIRKEKKKKIKEEVIHDLPFGSFRGAQVVLRFR